LKCINEKPNVVTNIENRKLRLLVTLYKKPLKKNSSTVAGNTANKNQTNKGFILDNIFIYSILVFETLFGNKIEKTIDIKNDIKYVHNIATKARITFNTSKVSLRLTSKISPSKYKSGYKTFDINKKIATNK
jgi:hypothetical protein